MIDFIRSQNGRIIISILWGFALATIFKKTCKNNRCITVKAPNKDFIEDNSFKYQGNDECFSYEPKIMDCKKK